MGIFSLVGTNMTYICSWTNSVKTWAHSD